MGLEIKFRAYIENEMNYFDFQKIKKSYEFDTGLKLIFGEDFHDDFYYDDFSKVTLMQYTGLKDKNGKEIYSDDILSDLSNDEECLFRIYSCDGGFGIKASHWRENMDELKVMDYLILLPLLDAQTQSWILSCCEVIGNVYENPELL